MTRFKNIMKKLLCPPKWVHVLLSVVCIAALAGVFYYSMEEHPAAYVIYPLSAYALTIDCIAIYQLHMIRKAKAAIYANAWGNRYMTDKAFHLRVSLRISLTVSVVYSALKMMASVHFQSTWIGAVAIYHALLSVVRFFLLKNMHFEEGSRDMAKEYRLYRLCGYLIICLHLTLTGIIFQMVWENRGFTYPGYLIFVMAAYTFYLVATSVANMIKYRKYNNPVMSAAKAINFVTALVSLLSLETAMLTQFGEMGQEMFRTIMVMATGGGICIITMMLSVYMIMKSNRELEKLENT